MRFVVYLVIEQFLVLILLGYFTVLERKLLGYGQFRKGPNKAVLWGLLQPLLDGFKLFMKGYWGLADSGMMNLWLFPGISLFLVLVLWGVLSTWAGVYGFSHLILFLILLGSLVGISLFLSGYFTGGKYSIWGSLRSLVQVMAFEGVLVIGLLSVLILGGSIGGLLSSCFYVLSVIMLCLIVVSVVMESNRTPTDFIEGESELVSGLATEMGGLSFSLLFMTEYGLMGFYALFIGCYVAGSVLDGLMVLLLAMMIMCLFGLLRLSLPRSRYDFMVEWGWKVGIVLVFMMYAFVYVIFVD